MNKSISKMDAATVDNALRLIQMALHEDLNEKVDCTSWATIPETASGSARFVARENGMVCGIAICQLIVAHHSKNIDFAAACHDGDSINSGQSVATLSGSAREILTLERTCLNFLGRLSGVASLTRKFVDETRGTMAQVLDTRKTTPGWRRLEKYAVICGGGANHRLGLFDAILIKDNHIAICGALREEQKRSITEILAIANQWKNDHRDQLPYGDQTIVQLEVDSLEQLVEALDARVDIILLDNMNVDQLAAAVEIRNQMQSPVLLEASGGVRLDSIRNIAISGVDRISVGALTHSAVNFDIGLDWD